MRIFILLTAMAFAPLALAQDPGGATRTYYITDQMTRDQNMARPPHRQATHAIPVRCSDNSRLHVEARCSSGSGGWHSRQGGGMGSFRFSCPNDDASITVSNAWDGEYAQTVNWECTSPPAGMVADEQRFTVTGKLSFCEDIVMNINPSTCVYVKP